MKKKQFSVLTVFLAVILLAAATPVSGQEQVPSLVEIMRGNLLPPQQEVHNHLLNSAEKLGRLLDAAQKGNIPQDQYHALLRAAIADVESARAANKLGLDRCNCLLNEAIDSATFRSLVTGRDQIRKNIEQRVLAPQQETHNHLYNSAEKLGRLLDATLKGNIPQSQYHALLHAVIADVESARAANKKGLENTAALLADEMISGESYPPLETPVSQAFELLHGQMRATAGLLNQTREKIGQIQAATQGSGLQHSRLADLIRAAAADLELTRTANDQGLKQTKELLAGEQIGSSGRQTDLNLGPERTRAIQEKVLAPQQVSANHLTNLREKLEQLLHGTLKKNLNQSQLNALARNAMSDLDSARSAQDSARQNLESISRGY